jgi:hypothetical protein
MIQMATIHVFIPIDNSPAVVRKHYGKWPKGRQDNIERIRLPSLRGRALQTQSQNCHTGKWGP